MSFWCREGQKENKVMQIKYSLLVLKRKIEAREEWGEEMHSLKEWLAKASLRQKLLFG